jgi:Zn-dependent protease/predicted transcriptional regulator
MFRNAIDVFKVFGFRIKIDPTWFLIVILIVWSLSTAYFPNVLPGYTRTAYILLSILAALCLFGSLILHELSHSLVARQFGVKINGITLFIFGGVAELENEPVNARSEFWIAVAGPAMSLFLGGASLIVSAMIEASGLSAAGVVLFSYIGLINLVLAGFNLVPAFPLDGGRILRAAIWAYKGDLIRATQIASWAGSIFGYILMFSGFWALFSNNMVGGLWQVLIGLFVLSSSKGAYQHLVTKEALKDQTVRALMTQQSWTAAPTDTLDYMVSDIMLRHNVSFVPVLEGEQLRGYVDTALAQQTAREDWPNTRIGDICVTSNEVNTVAADFPTQSLMEKVANTGQRKFLVQENGKLAGVITLADLTTYLAIRQGLGYPK